VTRRRLVPRPATVAAAAILVAMIVRVPDAPATVAEQRARLPPPADCGDKVEGKWKALVYQPNGGAWYEWSLEIYQDDEDPTILTGTTYVDLWTGPEDQPEPVQCTEFRFKGKMKATGTFTNGIVAFNGGPFELLETVCGSYFGYNPDNFSGKLDTDLQEFQSVNNDGGISVNQPVVFRRIGCFDEANEPKTPPADIEKPSFYPKKKTASSSGGCL
jgi:hypothetical protein